MVETAGSKLRRARRQGGFGLDDVARATKIRPAQLADLESDEYSNFANLAYAKGFLVSYAKFLEVDVREDLAAFVDSNTFGLDDYQYLNERPLGEYRAPTRPWRRKRRQGRLLVGSALALAAAFAVCVSYLYISYQRLGDLDKLAERQAARERTDGNRSVVPGTAAERVNTPVIVPVSATPLPSVAPAAPAPVQRAVDLDRTPGAVLASDGLASRPLLTLTQLNLGDAKAPTVAKAQPVSAAAPAAAAVPAAAADPLLIHARGKSADAYRGAAKSTKVANASVE